jgi:hypothetical protein
MSILRPLALPALAALLAAASDDDSTPEGILKGKGLTVSRKVFVIESEQAVIDFVDRLKPAVDAMAEAYDELLTAVSNNYAYQYFNGMQQRYDTELKHLNNQIPRLAAQVSAQKDKTVQAQMQFQLDQVTMTRDQTKYMFDEAVGQSNTYRPLTVPPQRIDRLKQVYQEKRAEYLRKAAGLNAPYEVTKKEYAKLKVDQTVKNVLKEFNRQNKVSYPIGPSKEFNVAISAVKKVQAMYTPEVKPRKVGGGGGRRS